MDPVHLDIETAFAVYRLPHQEDHLLVRGPIVDIRPSAGAFAVQRFDKKDRKTLYIQAKEVLKNARWQIDAREGCMLSSTDKDQYLNAALPTIAALKDQQMEKVVLSKIKKLTRDGRDLYDIFVELKEMYPTAFVFIYNVPGEGLWCGATPELLITSDEDHLATTMALAGTQQDQGLPLNQVKWGDKEIHEQRVIEEYVEQRLGDREIAFSKDGPHTVKAGQVLHLCSIFRMTDIDDPMLIANILHPGPAICGRPQEKAMEWILDHEDHDRAHYCGFIGPWNINGVKSLYINLRSMRIYNDAYILYLGGGLTKDSDAEAEWQETELKAQTLLSVINKTEVHE